MRSRPARVQLNSRRARLVASLFVAILMLGGCAPGPHRLLHPYGAPAHSLTVAQVMVRVPREQLLEKASADYKLLLESGIPDSEIRDETVVIGRVNCCYEDLERAFALAFYLPASLGANLGDIVEVRLGRVPEKEGEPGEANQATRVVQKRDENRGCRWEPAQQGAMRPYGSVIYCDWMREQGWVAEGPAPSIYKTWIRNP